MEVSIIEAAAALQVSTQTVRRRLTKGIIKGYKRETPQGFVWMIHMEPFTDGPTVKGVTQDGNHANVTDDGNHANNTNEANDSALVEILREELTEKNRQISELHRLLAQTALNAAPGRPWWQFWR